MSPPRLRALLAPALLLGCATVSRPAAPALPPAELGEIERLEDRRSLGGGALVSMATAHADPVVRARALVALGRIEDPSTSPAIQRGLQDADATVRDRAAFAAGLLGLSWVPLPDATRDALAAAVAAADRAHPGDGPRRSFLDAMARLGGAAAQEPLVSIVRGASADDERLARAAIGLGLIAKKAGKMEDAPAQAVLQRWFDTFNRPRLRYALAYAMASSKLPSMRAPALSCVKEGTGPAAATADEDAGEATALCVRALIEAGQEEDVPAVRAALAHRDYRVASEATRALVRFAQRAKDSPGRAKAAVQALGDLSRKVELLAKGDVPGGAQPLLQLAKLDLPDEAQPLLAALRQQLQARQKAASGAPALDLARIDCRLAAAQDRHAGEVKQVLACGDRLPPEPWRLALALGQIDHAPKGLAAKESAFAGYLSHPSPAVQAAALQAVAAVKDAPAQAAVRALLDSKDLVVASYAAAAAAALGDSEAVPKIARLAAAVKEHPDLSEGIASALVELKAPQAREILTGWLSMPHAHLRHVAVQFLQKLGGPVPVPAAVAGEDAPFTPAPLNAMLVLRTARGRISVLLDSLHNPRTSANIWHLAKKGFFNGLTFHRVEPNFVVQGGDPRGDGDGGPGYTIRCEVTDRRYLRGTIGMALSGQDTGGSQFFFTTSEQPHLEGRYTAFGEVAEGMEVVDALMEGEVITQVEATESVELI